MRSRQVLAATWARVTELVGWDEICHYGGLLLIAAGFWEWWRPGAFLVPGAVLVWITLPCRAPFIERPKAGKGGD